MKRSNNYSDSQQPYTKKQEDCTMERSKKKDAFSLMMNSTRTRTQIRTFSFRVQDEDEDINSGADCHTLCCSCGHETGKRFEKCNFCEKPVCNSCLHQCCGCSESFCSCCSTTEYSGKNEITRCTTCSTTRHR